MDNSPDKQPVSSTGVANKNPEGEASPGASQTAENICRTCKGTGRFDDKACPTCGGTGKVIETVGDA
jgi:DnaJ-class molecular chaperone